jgi:hypothetical protein
MKKNLLSFAIVAAGLIFSFSTVSAQESENITPSKGISRVGIQAGYNHANQLYYADGLDFLNDHLKPLSGFNAGIFTENGSSDYFTTMIGIFYSSKGSSEKGGSGVWRGHYLQVPLMFNFRMPIYGPVFMKVGLGPYIAYAFAGKEKSEGSTSRDIFGFPASEERNKYKNKPYTPLDYGLMFGGQVEYVLPDKRTIEIGVRYGLGIQSISNPHGTPELFFEDFGLKNNVLSVNLIYSFDVSK